MSTVETILRVFRKKKELGEDDTPPGYCPNCWGRQEYGQKFYKAALNQGVNINDPGPKKGWIQQYVDENLSQIQLKYEDEMLVCPHCKLTYRPT